MISDFGYSLLLTALVVSFIGIIIPLYIGARQNDIAPRMALRFAQINLGFLLGVMLVAIGLLLYAFLISDFSLKVVTLNSNALEPLMYRFVALWGNHEGSMLLWVLTLCLYGFTFAVTGRDALPDKLKSTMLSLFHALIFGFILFLVMTSNPFEGLSQVPHKGLGLNPILQDASMTFHPPSLYFGYIGFSVPFVMALAFMMVGKFEKDNIFLLKTWTYIPWAFLTFGVTAGSLWAYYELGWGGWWAWDPVENASLLPWITSTAALHSFRLYAQSVSKGRALIVLLMSAASWLLSLLGTYITRSGIVASVHGFAQDDQRGLFLLVFLGVLVILTLVSVISFFLKHRCKIQLMNQGVRHYLSKVNIVFMVAIVGLLILGTLAPLMIDAALSVDFYNQILVPMGLLILVAMACVPFFKWAPVILGKVFRPYVFHFNMGLLALLLVLYQDSFLPSWWAVFASLGIALSIVVLGTTFKEWRKSKLHVMTLAHIGFAVMTLGMSLNVLYKQESHFWIAPGTSGFVGDYEILLKGVNQDENKLYVREFASLDVINFKGDIVVSLFPETRLYKTQQVLVSKTSIAQRYWVHLYAILGPQATDGKRSIQIYYHPFVNLIWGGGFLMLLAGLLSLFRKRRSLRN